MSRMVIVIGDVTSGGGSVITGSNETDIDGKPVARVNDKATCPRHKGVFPIVSGDMTFIIDKQPVARHGDYLACGCRLMSARQFGVFLDEGTSDNPAADKVMFDSAGPSKARYYEQYRAIDSATGQPVADQPYRIDLADGTSRTGKTDSQGLTIQVATAAPEQVRLSWLDVWHSEENNDDCTSTMEGC